MNAEYWDLFDRNRNMLGVTHKRGDPVPDGAYHLVVHAWIINKQGEFLFSQRCEGIPYAGLWERTGGSALAGENSLDAAKREVKEELDIDLQNCPYYFLKSVWREKYHDVYDSWLFIVDKRSFICQTGEVAAAEWLTIEQLRKLDNEKKIVRSSRYFAEVYNFYRSLKK